MKKFALIVLTCMLLVFLLTGCSRKEMDSFNGSAPEELYSASLESAAVMDNYELEIVQETIGTAFLFIKSTATTTTRLKFDGYNFQQIFEADENVMAQLPADTVVNCWGYDGYLYAIHPAAGRYIKQAYTYSEVEGGFFDYASLNNLLLDVPEDWFGNSAIYKEKKEVYMEFVVDGQEFYDMIYNTTLAAKGYVGSATSDVTYRVYYNEDGSINKVYTYFEFSVEQGGIKVDMEFKQTASIKNVGTTTITLPAEAAAAETSSMYRFYFK